MISTQGLPLPGLPAQEVPELLNAINQYIKTQNIQWLEEASALSGGNAAGAAINFKNNPTQAWHDIAMLEIRNAQAFLSLVETQYTYAVPLIAQALTIMTSVQVVVPAVRTIPNVPPNAVIPQVSTQFVP
jgi:hypothetical protein